MDLRRSDRLEAGRLYAGNSKRGAASVLDLNRLPVVRGQLTYIPKRTALPFARSISL